MAVEVNPNLGKGSDMVRMMALSGIKNDQQALIAQMGLSNPICGAQEMLNTMTDMLSLANVKNVGRYFKTPNPQEMQQLASAPKQPDAQTMAAQAMLEKVRMDGAKAVGQQHLDTQKMQTENEFKHTQLQAKTQIDLQKLEMQGQQMGVDRHVALAQLASKLMSDQQDSEAQDQQSQQEHGRVADEAGPAGAAGPGVRAPGEPAGGLGHGGAPREHGQDLERSHAGHDRHGGAAPPGDDRARGGWRQDPVESRSSTRPGASMTPSRRGSIGSTRRQRPRRRCLSRRRSPR